MVYTVYTMKKYLYSIVPVLSVLVCSLFLFTTLDDKVYDSFLRTIPTLTEDPSVLLINIDDTSIEKVGLFPWTRDIMADAIVFLREMGADSVIFDLSYLDKSPVKVDPVYVKEELPGYLDYGFNQINETVAQVMDAFAAHQIGPKDAAEYKKQIIEFNKTVRNSLDASISYVTRDVDAYFAKTLRFFGKSYLTISMVTPENIGEGHSFDMSQFDLPWLEENIALKNITIKRDTLTPEALGIIPAIPELIRNTHGAGFVNAPVDPDGYRRRIYLLNTFRGKYYGQFTFVPLLEKMGNPSIEVTNSTITLKDAVVKGIKKNIRIPRSEDGSILVNWPKKPFIKYNHIIAWQLIGNNEHETKFVKNLKAMEDSGFFSYWEKGETPLEKYNNAKYMKELLFEGEKPAENITFETYRAYRDDFIKTTDLYLNGDYENRILSDVGEADIDTRAYVTTFFTTSRDQYAELLRLREKVRTAATGAFCIIGVDVSSETDNGLTTFQERYPNVGIHATVANMILSQEFLDDAPAFMSILIALILAIGLGFGIKRLDTKQSMFAGIATLILSVFALLVYFMLTHTYVGVVVPFASVTATFVTLTAINFLNTIKEKTFLRSAFSRYLSPAVINEIIADPSKLNLGGEKREMTAIFTDIKGFSTISEKLDPTDLVNLLNMYLTEMSNIVMNNRGTIDKYEGDAIIAFFGAPIHMNEHASLACRTAILMKKAEVILNKRIMEENLSPTPLFTRIGINTGDMIVGNMGTPNKMDYTIMGNAVNLAARLEGVNKQYITRGILISEHTRKQLGDEFLLRRLDRVRVVGVNTPLRLYELIAVAADSDEILTSLVSRWEHAIDLYEKQDFSAAKELFATIAAEDASDTVVALYITRCTDFINTPPETNWDGVFNLTQK